MYGVSRHQAKKKNKEKVQRLARHGEQRRAEARKHQRLLAPNSQRWEEGEQSQ